MFLRSLLFFLLFPATDSMAPAVPAMMAPVQAYVSPIPLRATPRAELETQSHAHHQVLRVKRDFGDAWRDIVIDAWVPKAGEPSLTEVRLWWVESNDGDIRKPFGKKTRKRVKVSYDRVDDAHWVVTFGAGGRSFDFDVELEGKTPTVYANIKSGREKIDRCRVDNARLYAKKMLDVTVGLDRLEVDCVDASGKKHTGDLRRG